MGIRRTNDGSYWSTRPTEEFKEKGYQLVNDHWYPNLDSLRKTQDLAGIHAGKTLTMIGKGPSLDLITKIEGPILCLNQSVQVIEKIADVDFVIQSDGDLREKCLPQKATLLLSEGAKGWYENYPNRIIFHPLNDLKAPIGQISATYGLYFAKLMGITKVILKAFDASMNGNLTYAKSVGPVLHYNTERRTGQRFLGHRTKIEETAKRLQLLLEWRLT